MSKVMWENGRMVKMVNGCWLRVAGPSGRVAAVVNEFLIGGEEESKVYELACYGAGRFRQRRFGRWVHVGKGGPGVGKQTVFAHLFPQDSTQVVDFPHLAMVSQAELGTKVGELGKTAETQRRRGGAGGRIQREAGGGGGKRGIGERLEAGFSEKWLCSIIRIYTHLSPFITCS